MIITITREFGSGGRTIAKKLAEKLGYAYYDYEIVQQIAQESGFAKSTLKKMGKMHLVQVHLALFGIIMDITYRTNSILRKEM